MRTEEPSAIRLSDYAPPAFAVEHVDLDFMLDPADTRVTSRMSLTRTGTADAALFLDGEAINLVAIWLDGRKLTEDQYSLTPDGMTIPDLPDSFELKIETTCRPEKNTALSGLYMSGGRFCTQCEAEGFRRITYFPDRPDVLSRYTVRMEADKAAYPTLLANGNLDEAGDLDGGRHYAIWRDPFPKPAYLFALVAGTFDLFEDSFTTVSGREIPLRIYVDPGEASRAAYAMDALKRSMRWDEEAFGREYDLDLFMIVAVRDFNFGAMENKGLNVFNSALLLADPETATDADYEAIESVVAHEYFHNWTGNRITCRDWFQLCLKEGLTVFRDQEFSADQRNRAIQRIKDVRALRRTQFPEDAGPLAHPVRPESYMKIDNFYTRTVYEKGAEIVRMMHRVLGPQAFRAGMDRYFETCDGMAATVEDFLTALQEGSGRDLTGFMGWYRQAGTPRLTVETAYDAAAGALELTLSQRTPATPGQAEKTPVPIPFTFGLLDSAGAPMAARLDGENAPAQTERTLVLETAEQTWRFVDLPERPALSPLRGFSAPVILEAETDTAATALLSISDPDLFNRWEAGQGLMRDRLKALTEAAAKGEDLDAGPELATIWAAQLADEALDPSYVALALAAPSEKEIGQSLESWDPAAVHAAREAMVSQAAAAVRPALEATYARLNDNAPVSVTPEAAGRRALKNTALGLLAHLGAEAVEDLAWAQFERARTMTDRLAALAALDGSGSEKFDAALDAFYQQWKSRPLVLDKWFRIQATSARPDAFARVKGLTEHGRFDASNPNRVRSLVGAFAMENPLHFNAADGSGYAFLADWVLKIDRGNPALAARLLGAMESWRILEPRRAAKAKAELERVKASASSKNVLEIAGKSLTG